MQALRSRPVGGKLVATLLAFAALAPASALGAFPGQNGRIVYDDIGNVHSVTPDGSGHMQLTTDGGFWAEWSPDGKRIAFTSDRGGLGNQLYVMNADGSAQTRLTDPPAQASQPAWAPDGQRIVFERNADIWVMDSDGSGAAPVTTLPGNEWSPDWSPDGSEIAFARSGGAIWAIRPDGTGLRQITAEVPGRVKGSPDWSPDGTRIVYLTGWLDFGERCTSIDRIGADGTGAAVVRAETCESDVSSNLYADPGWSPDGQRIASSDGIVMFTVRADGSDYRELPDAAFTTDWQPLTVDTPSAYVRPVSASRVQFSLVPAFNPCTSPNREHGPPLAHGSCAPPQPGSSHLTVGVGDGHPALARSTGFVRLKVFPGAPGGVDDTSARLRLGLTNVMRAADRSDYTGELRGSVLVRITDREGLSGSPSQTIQDFPLEWTVPCTATTSTVDGASCDLGTELDALLPGATPERTRAIWQLDRVRVHDGGADEDGDTEHDNKLFAVQGVFVP